MRSKVQSGPRPETEFLKMLGERVRQERSRREITRKELAKAAYVSERFLAQLETGHGNISIIRLRRIAHAMGMGVERLAQEKNGDAPEMAGVVALLEKLKPEERRRAQAMLLEKFGARSEEERRGRIALVGMRGAGKSTLGALLAERIGAPFIELDRKIEQESGVKLSARPLLNPPWLHSYNVYWEPMSFCTPTVALIPPLSILPYTTSNLL